MTYFVPKNKRVSDLLKDFQRMRIQMAIVVDEENLLMIMRDDSFVGVIPMLKHQVIPLLKSDAVGNKNLDAYLSRILAYKELVL